MRTRAVVALLAVSLLAACSGGEADKPARSDAQVREAKRKACIKPWDNAVDEWNRLVDTRDATKAHDVVVDGVTYVTYDEWAAATGKPLVTPEC